VASNIVRLALHAEAETVQVQAGKDVLDRAGYKPIEKAVTVNVTADEDSEIFKALAQNINGLHLQGQEDNRDAGDGIEGDGISTSALDTKV
jgi:hypothetical protein